MLPKLNLQLGELLKFDNSLNNMELLPQDAVLPEAAFGDLLELRLSEPPVIEFQPGETLPESGNALPPASPQEPLRPEPMPEAEALAERLQLSDLPRSSAETPVLPVATGESGAETAGVGPETGSIPDAAATIDLAMPDSEFAPATATAPAVEYGGREQLSGIDSLIARSAATSVATPVPDRGVQATAPDAGFRPDPGTVSDVARSTSPMPKAPAVTLRAPGEPPVPVADLDTGAPAASRNPLPETMPAAVVSADKLQPRPTELGGDDYAVLARATQPANPAASRSVPAQPAATQPSTAAHTFAVETPVQDTSWGERVGERVLLMASSQLKTAEIRLSPAELGPLRVQVSVDDGAASINFHAQHAVTRDAIEQALPRLREMFVESGLSLGQATVGDQSVAQQGSTSRDGEGDRAAAAAHAEEQAPTSASEADPTSRQVSASNSLVDTYV